MKIRPRCLTILLAFACGLSGSSLAASSDAERAEPTVFKIALDPGHPWRPPFGLDRIGRPVMVVVEASTRPDPANYFITGYSKGKPGASYPVRFSADAPHSARVTLDRDVDELVLARSNGTGKTRRAGSPGHHVSCCRSRGDRPARRDRKSRRLGCHPRSFRLALARPGEDCNARNRGALPHPRLAASAPARHVSNPTPPSSAR